MNTNEIIKNFNVDDNVVKDKDFLYFTFLINKSKAISKRASYIKVCVEKSSSGKFVQYDILNIDKINNRFLNSNNPKISNQYRYENIPLVLNLDNDDSYEEYIVPVSLIKVRSSILEQVTALEGLPGTSITAVFQKPHIFRIYFLDDNKNIVENYVFKTNNKRLSDYEVISISDRIDINQNLIESSFDIIFNSYNDNYEGGPIITLDEVVLNSESFSKTMAEIQINFNSQVYNIKPDNSSQNIFEENFVSNKLLENYSNNLIKNMFLSIADNNNTGVDIEISFTYKSFLFIKEKFISREKIIEYYNVFYQKHKDTVIKEIFRNKIRISPGTERGTPYHMINFLEVDLYLIPNDTGSKNFKINNQSSGKEGSKSPLINKLYTTKNLRNDYSITSRNGNFSLESIYSSLTSNVYYTRRSRDNQITITPPEPDRIIVKYENVEIYPIDTTQVRSIVNVEENNTKVTSSNSNSRFFNDLINNSFSNPNFISSGFELDFNHNIIATNKNLLDSLSYETASNDFLSQEVAENTFMSFSMSYSPIGSNDVLQRDFNFRLSDLISDDLKKIKIPISNMGEFTNTKIITRSITMPNGTHSSLVSENNIDDNKKEETSKFLNEILPGEYSKIDNLLRNSLFTNTSNNSINKKINSIFNLSKDKLSNKVFFVNNKTNIQEIDDEEQTEDIEDTNAVSNINIEQELYNITNENNEYYNKFTFKSYYDANRNNIRLFSKKKEGLSSIFDVKDLFENKDINNYTFNISKMITFEFNPADFNSSNNVNNIKEKRFLLKPGSSFIFKNIPFFIEQKKLYLSNIDNNVLEINKSVYSDYRKVWGRGNQLFVRRVLERFCIIINNKKDNSLHEKILINNYVNQSLLLTTNSFEFNVLSSNLHMPNIKLEYI
jgi:hypothetical protein